MKMIYQTSKRTFTVILMAVFPLISVQASALQSHAGISKAVKQFVVQQRVPLKKVRVRLTSLNNKIRLPRCGKKLQVNMAPGTKLLGHTSLSVSCSSPQKWKIRVAAHVDGLVNTLVARHPIPRGTLIQNSDLKYTTRRYSQLNYGYYGSVKQLNGMETRRNIKSGQVLTPSLVKAPKIVLRGQHITIVAQNGRLNLRVKGKAMMDGKQGQTIKVKNLSSKKLIYAQVVSSGVVKVNY